MLDLAGIKEGVWVGLILFVGAELFVKGYLGLAESSKVCLDSSFEPRFAVGTLCAR